MSVFVQKVNPLTGRNDWIPQNEDYDYHQEVARSAFADMLHDTERNQLYEKALKVAIDKLHSVGQKAKVLDIGRTSKLCKCLLQFGILRHWHWTVINDGCKKWG